MAHKFKVGQRVSLVQHGLPGDQGTAETFEVLRLMPEDQTGEPSYRVLTRAGERAIREGQLVAARR